MIRSASVMGKFYPGNTREINSFLKKWKRNKPIPACSIALVPHAGYLFSGECAWLALTSLDWDSLDQVVIVGPSHRIAFSGVSIFQGDSYETVEAEHPMSSEFATELKEELALHTFDSAHHEHSTEVQVPMIHALAPNVQIVECVYSQSATDKLIELMVYLFHKERTGIIVSSDLSHYYSELTAHNLDGFVENAIKTLNLHELKKGEACGMPGIAALIHMCRSMDLSMKVTDYRTSADSSYGDSQAVVGYLSAVVHP